MTWVSFCNALKNLKEQRCLSAAVCFMSSNRKPSYCGLDSTVTKWRSIIWDPLILQMGLKDSEGNVLNFGCGNDDSCLKTVMTAHLGLC